MGSRIWELHLINADGRGWYITLALSRRWKIKHWLSLNVSSFILSITWEKRSCFQLYFSTFNTFFIGIMNVQDYFFCRERGVESIQMWNKWLLYRSALQDVTLDQTGGFPGQPRGQELPGTPWNSLVRIRLVSQQSCRTLSPPWCLRLCSSRSPPPVVTQ